MSVESELEGSMTIRAATGAATEPASGVAHDPSSDPRHPPQRSSTTTVAGLGVLDTFEQAFALFHRSLRNGDTWIQFAGSTPFVVALFIACLHCLDYRVSAIEMAEWSLALAFLYAVKAVGSQGYMRRLLRPSSGTADGTQTAALGVGLARTFGAAGFWALAWLVTLPFTAFIAPFYMAAQYTPLLRDAEPRRGFASTVAESSRLSFRWYLAQQGILGIFLLLFVVILLDVASGTIVFEALVPLLTGSTPAFSRDVWSQATSGAFWMWCVLSSYLLLDPLAKAVAAISFFHLRAERSGADLWMQLRDVSSARQASAAARSSWVSPRSSASTGAAIAMLFALGFAASPATARASAVPATASASHVLAPLPARAAADNARPPSTATDPTAALQRAVALELRKSQYRWHGDESVGIGWNALFEAIDRATKFIGKIIAHIIRWIFGGSDVRTADGGRSHVRAWAWLLIAIFVAALVLFLLRRRRPPVSSQSPLAATAEPVDLETALATDRTRDDWLRLAERLQAEGNTRMAIRAAFLACLAALADRRLLLIRRGRTNCDYLRELRRREEAMSGLRTASASFDIVIAIFERVWYGEQSAPAELFDDFIAAVRGALT
jgi:hypothetical protein